MFPLHETTQRRVCRVLFILCCVMPTLATLGWIAYFYRPWRQADWQQNLAEQLHVNATVQCIAKPKPGITSIGQVGLADLRSQQKLGQLNELTLENKGSASLLKAKQLMIQSKQLTKTIEALATWISSSPSQSLSMECEEVLIVDGDSVLTTWNNFRMTNSLQAGRTNLQFKTESATSPVMMLVEHQSKQGTPTINLLVDTKDASLPAWLLDTMLFGNTSHDSKSQFIGKIHVAWSPEQTEGTLSGKIEAIDLGQWLASSIGHRLESESTLQLDKVTWRDGEITSAQGKLDCQAGSVSNSLVNAAVLYWKCGTTLDNTALNDPNALLQFDQLAIRFQLNETSIKILGDCSPGCLLRGQNGPLLMEPQKLLPAVSLVQLLGIPKEGCWLPGTKEAHNMARRLSLPSGKK